MPELVYPVLPVIISIQKADSSRFVIAISEWIGGNYKTGGSVLIWRGARIVPNPQRLNSAGMLRVGTTRAPLSNLKFKLGQCQTGASLAPARRGFLATRD